MSIVTLAQAKAQMRITSLDDQDIDSQVQGFIDAAEGWAMEFIDRNMYIDQPTLLAAQVQAPINLAAANAAWKTAIIAANGVPIWPPVPPGVGGVYTGNYWYPAPENSDNDLDTLAQYGANIAYRAARAEAERVYAGLYATKSITVGDVTTVSATPKGAIFVQAILLACSNYDVNREAVVTEQTVALDLPYGVRDLLTPLRGQMGVG